MTGEKWDLDQVIRIFEREVNARERALVLTTPYVSRKPQSQLPTAAALVASNSGMPNASVNCVYCGQDHQSTFCTTVTDANARKEVLRKTGRYYICLRKNHLSRNCRSKFSCRKCRGRHHVSICPRHGTEPDTNIPSLQGTAHRSFSETSLGHGDAQRTTSILCAGVQTPVLLQTAQIRFCNLNLGIPIIIARAIMDSGSQRTYITCRLWDKLKLPTMGTESLQIKTFGSLESHYASYDVVQLGLVTKGNETLKMTALVVPFICNSLTSQPICYSKEFYDHLLGLELADSASVSDTLEIDLLIGLDLYWDLVTGRVIRGRSGPTAIHTKVGWVLSGPTEQQEVAVNLTFTSTHALKVDAYPIEPTLDDNLKQFWELESLGIMRDA